MALQVFRQVAVKATNQPDIWLFAISFVHLLNLKPLLDLVQISVFAFCLYSLLFGLPSPCSPASLSKAESHQQLPTLTHPSSVSQQHAQQVPANVQKNDEENQACDEGGHYHVHQVWTAWNHTDKSDVHGTDSLESHRQVKCTWHGQPGTTQTNQMHMGAKRSTSGHEQKKPTKH